MHLKGLIQKELNQLGTYWLEKLPNVSFEETLLSCIEKKAYGTQPGHAQFYYPKKYGYGELWLRMAEKIKENIEYNKIVKGIDFSNRMVTTADGEKYQADIIITTIPWMEFEEIAGMPDDIRESIKKLKFSSIQTEYFAENLDTTCQWIYYPDPKLSYHRILVRHNFCPDSKGYWTETNSERIDMEEPNDNFKYMNQYNGIMGTLIKTLIGVIPMPIIAWFVKMCIHMRIVVLCIVVVLCVVEFVCIEVALKNEVIADYLDGIKGKINFFFNK